MQVVNFLLILLPISIYATQYQPLLSKLPGIISGSGSKPIEIQLIYDPMCDDTAIYDQKWATIQKDIKDQYADKVNFRYVSFALPYHLTAQKCTQAIIYVKQNKGDAQALQLLRYFLQNIQQYDENYSKTVTIRQIEEKIATYVSAKYNVDKTDLLKNLKHYSAYDGKQRQWWKFCTGTLRNPGTPSIYLNWAPVEKGTELTSAQWITLLKSITN